MNELFALKDKTILVTGASSGIGRQVCIACAESGAKLILTGRDSDKLEHSLTLLKGEGHLALRGDLTEPGFIEHICKEIPEIDGVVQSAGIMKLLPLKFIKGEDIDEIISINLRAPILLVSGLSRLKKLKQKSSIILLSSINGAAIGSLANSVYGASKGGIQSFCKSSALELAKNNIRINCIAPGMVETEGIEQINEQVSAQSLEADKKKYPLSRYGVPEDIAAICLFLLSDASSWITGTTIVADGGYTAQ
ncbi:MAG TPA: SDR family oxidoreductase [Mucilaginibacter sp.]|jgi:NAD(P)-dependent dehydrogenase (short-subunit alcohol dehydrogenase family)